MLLNVSVRTRGPINTFTPTPNPLVTLMCPSFCSIRKNFATPDRKMTRCALSKVLLSAITDVRRTGNPPPLTNCIPCPTVIKRRKTCPARTLYTYLLLYVETVRFEQTRLCVTILTGAHGFHGCDKQINKVMPYASTATGKWRVLRAGKLCVFCAAQPVF